MPKIKRTSSAQRSLIVEMYDPEGSNMSIRQIANVFRLAPSTVRYHLLKQGVILREPGGKFRQHLDCVSHREMETIRFLYEEKGLTLKEISSLVGMHETSIHYRIRWGGIKRRSLSDSRKLAWLTRRGQRPDLKLIENELKQKGPDIKLEPFAALLSFLKDAA